MNTNQPIVIRNLPASAWKSIPVAINLNVNPHQDVWYESRWWVMDENGPLIMCATSWGITKADAKPPHDQRAQTVLWLNGPYSVGADGAHETEESLIRYIIRDL